MKITCVSYERLDLKLAEPYTIAYETVSHTTNFILRIETDTGITGLGCAAPDVAVTVETTEEVERNMNAVVIPYLLGRNPLEVPKLLQDLAELLSKKASTLAMVDMALLDIGSKKMEVPLYQFLGGYRRSIPTSITIGILPLSETLEKAKAYIALGFNIIKLKGGTQVEEDIQKVRLLRERFPDVTLRFDANQGYSLSDALAFFEATRKVGIEIFEQPSPVARKALIGNITEAVGYPVMADESIKTLEDVYELARMDAVDMINIKLMKVGGIREAMHINSVARAAGLEAMVGCLDECALGISAGLHFALSRPNIQFADLDGHLELLDDPFKNLFTLKEGVLYPNDSPGLGKRS